MAVTNYEKLLQSISDGTPSEVYPVTREEQYLAYIAGESATYPDSPITRREMYLEQIAENGTGGGGSAKPSQTKTVEITENGTYSITPDFGYTLSRVTANVTVETGGGLGKIAAFLDKSITEVTAEDLKGATQIGDGAFSGCSSLTSITIPDSVTSIGYAAFDNCSSLTSVIIGNSVTYIGVCAFQRCSSLESLTFPASVARIDEGATYLTPIKTITMLGSVPPTLVYAFDSNKGIEKIIVPKGCGEVYKSHTNWAKFGDIIEEAEA